MPWNSFIVKALGERDCIEGCFQMKMGALPEAAAIGICHRYKWDSMRKIHRSGKIWI
ncbi:MAG: hypothetical protein HFI01_11410 [Lachnospiraceae bacterium]|nr:hypothetical protein [Lachnospiraceae bacterium]